MKLLGKLPIDLPYLVCARVGLDAEHFIGRLHHSGFSAAVPVAAGRLFGRCGPRRCAPLTATTRSLVLSPARSAGEPGSIRAITAPWVRVVPSAWAMSGVRSWIA